MSMSKTKINFFALAGTVVMAGGFTAPVCAGEIFMLLEEPEASAVYSGVANLRGWALSTSGVDRVELHIDGTYLTNIPVGGARGDVAKAFPQIPDSINAGFSMALNYSLLTPGDHLFLIRVVDLAGATKETSVTIPVQRFNAPFISDATQINASTASFTASGNRLQINGLSVNGQSFDAALDWRSGAQGFRFSSIAADNGGGGGGDQCVSVPLVASGAHITWQISGTQEGQTLSGTIDTHYNSVSTTQAVTDTDSTVTVAGVAASTHSLTTQHYHIDNNLLYVERLDVTATATVFGFPVSTTSVVEFSPAQLAGPAQVYCLNQTWTSPAVTQTTTVNGQQTVNSSPVLTGVVEAINESITSPAGSFNTVRTRVATSADNSVTHQWLSTSNGQLIRQTTHAANGTLISTTEATQIQ